MKTRIRTLLFSRPDLWRWAFWLYTAVLTAFLLWPRLTLPPVMPRPDLLVHGLAFGLLTLLLCLWNPARSTSPAQTALLAFAVGTVYGGITELLQQVPALKRTGALDDWGADVFGVVCGLLAFGFLRVWPRAM